MPYVRLLALLLAFAPTVGAAQEGEATAPDEAASAPDKAAVAAAEAAYQRGVEHFEAGRFRDAVAEFNKAFRTDPNPVLVFNIARAFEEMGDYASAIEFYRRYLEMAPDAPDRKAVGDALRALEILMREAARLSVESEPPGARVEIAGKHRGATPLQVDLPAGQHEVVVSAPGFLPSEAELSLGSGEKRTHRVALSAAPVIVESADRTWVWVSVGVGGALIAGGAVFAALAADRASEVDAIEADPAGYTLGDYRDAQDEGKLFAGLADGMLITGGVALGTALVLWLIEDDVEPTVAPAVGPVSGLRVRF